MKIIRYLILILSTGFIAINASDTQQDRRTSSGGTGVRPAPEQQQVAPVTGARLVPAQPQGALPAARTAVQQYANKFGLFNVQNYPTIQAVWQTLTGWKDGIKRWLISPTKRGYTAGLRVLGAGGAGFIGGTYALRNNLSPYAVTAFLTAAALVGAAVTPPVTSIAYKSARCSWRLATAHDVDQKMAEKDKVLLDTIWGLITSPRLNLNGEPLSTKTERDPQSAAEFSRAKKEVMQNARTLGVEALQTALVDYFFNYEYAGTNNTSSRTNARLQYDAVWNIIEALRTANRAIEDRLR